jgi:hypothetical protein
LGELNIKIVDGLKSGGVAVWKVSREAKGDCALAKALEACKNKLQM